MLSSLCWAGEYFKGTWYPTRRGIVAQSSEEEHGYPESLPHVDTVCIHEGRVCLPGKCGKPKLVRSPVISSLSLSVCISYLQFLSVTHVFPFIFSHVINRWIYFLLEEIWQNSTFVQVPLQILVFSYSLQKQWLSPICWIFLWTFKGNLDIQQNLNKENTLLEVIMHLTHQWACLALVSSSRRKETFRHRLT